MTLTRSRNLAEAHARVRSPLARLRGYIRSYVGIEGGLLLVLLTALWFWIGLSLDYGFFKLFAIDWVWPRLRVKQDNRPAVNRFLKALSA